MATLTLIVTYDVRDDDRRARLAATLQSVGDRIQKSVFVLMIDSQSFSELQLRASQIINPDTDSLLFFRQCVTCWDSHVPLGQGHVPDEVTHWAVF